MNAITVLDPESSFNIGKISGTIRFHQSRPNRRTKISFHLCGFPPNKIAGIHIHEFGDLSQGCDSACKHYNPYEEKHGNIELHGRHRHVGDLMNNVHADDRGYFQFEYKDDLVELFGENSVIGRSIVIHEKEDDLGRNRDVDPESAKTGNAGKRIACAIIGLAPSKNHKC